MKNRPSRDESMMILARGIAVRSTCPRRDTGCVLTDSYGRILSVGHNGVPRGQPHCIDEPCAGADEPSGYHLDRCMAVHAEMNALLFCKDIMQVHTCYTTASPCMSCIKVLLQSSCKYIIFDELYDTESLNLWNSADRHYIKMRI